jgi:hypothetical protein
MICAICLENIVIHTGSRLICGHIFHTHCLYVWFDTQHSCVICRRSISHKNQIVSLEEHFLTSHNGCILNGYQFFPKNIADLQIILLYLFLQQHCILFHYIPSHIENKLSHILQIMIENNYDNVQKPWTLLYYDFYKSNHLQIEYGSQYSRHINIHDMYSIYFSDGKNCGYLHKCAGYHGQQGIFQSGGECFTIC